MLAALYDLRFLLFPVGVQTNMAVVYSTGHFEPKKKREENHSHRDILLLTEFYIRTQEEDLLNFVFLLPSCRRRYSCHQLLFFSFGAGGRKRVAALCPSSCLIADTKHKSCRIAWPGGWRNGNAFCPDASGRYKRRKREQRIHPFFSPTPFRLSRCSAKMLHHSRHFGRRSV